VHDLFAALVDRDNQEDRGRRQRREHRLGLRGGHGFDPNVSGQPVMKRWAHGRHGAGFVRVHRRVPVAVPRLRHRGLSAALRRLHRTRRGGRVAAGGQVLHRAGRLAGGLGQRRRRRQATVSGRRRPHRQPEPTGQATSRP
jgi:hypothetical protein